MRGLTLVSYFNHPKLQKQLKIFIKTVINFSSYLLPYLILVVTILVVVTIVALNIFDPEAYLESRLLNAPTDNLVKYGVSSLELVFVSGWSEVSTV